LQFERGADRLPAKMCSGNCRRMATPERSDGRKNSGHQNDGDQAGENQEKQIFPVLRGGQRDQNDSADIEIAFARDFVIDFVAEPAEWGGGRARIGTSVMATQAATRSAANAEMLAMRRRPSSAAAPGIESKNQRYGDCRHRQKKARNPGAVGFGPRGLRAIEVTLTGRGSQGDGYRFDQFRGATGFGGL